jgi:hypothetical protein
VNFRQRISGANVPQFDFFKCWQCSGFFSKNLKKLYLFLAASTECSAGSNDHFVIVVVVVVGGVVVPSLAITQPCNARQQSHNNHATITQPCTQQNNHATLQHNNNATFNATIMQPCNTTIMQHNNHATLQCNNHATSQRNLATQQSCNLAMHQSCNLAKLRIVMFLIC